VTQRANVLRTSLIVLLAIVVAIAFARTLSFGHETPDSAPAVVTRPASPAPTPPPPARGAVVITVTPDGLTVRPSSARLNRGAVAVRVDNQAQHMVEVLIRRGKVQRLVQLGTGEQHDGLLKLPAGHYAVLARPLTEGNAPPAPATAVARLRVAGS
jgi:hypothetical protein